MASVMNKYGMLLEYIMTGEILGTWRKAGPNATLSTTDLTCTDLSFESQFRLRICI